MAKLVTVSVYRTEIDATLAQIELERSDIVAFVVDRQAYSVHGAGWPSDGVKLVVAEADAEAAVAALEPPEA